MRRGIRYNKEKTSIYINNINYCDTSNEKEYIKIECILYESVNNKESKIGSSIYKGKTPMQLEDYLKDVQFYIDTNSNTCKNYKNNSLYLQIKATDSNNKVTLYQIPLTMTNNC